MKSKMQIGSLSGLRLQSSLCSRVLLSVFLLAVPFLISCGGGGGAPPLSAIAVTISPSAVTMTSGETQTFTAAVTGSLNQMVTWSVQEGSAGGTINSSGVYLAPAAFGTYHVVATSQADPTKSGTATIMVAPVSVAIIPASVAMRLGATQTFAATVTGSSNTAVTWTVQEGATGGTITGAGFYTAPTTLGTFHVVATSVADPGKSASAAVTVVQSRFTPTGSMTVDRVEHTATLLPNGQVLMVGSDSSAELYDPVAGSFTRTGSMGTFRSGHTATLLPNGTVLIAGGFSATAEVYDPATGLFTPTGSMATRRDAHTATLLKNGTVLIAGGFSATADLTTAEVYDPATRSFMPTGSMASARGQHTATLLSNGTVLIAGGFSATGDLTTAEVYDPATRSFMPTGSMASPRSVHTATLLKNGAVLVAGGFFSGSSAELYDPAAGSFMPTGSMGTLRSFHTATLLPNGTVLIAGGFSATAEVYDPATGLFTPTGSMTQARGRHTATLLRNGDVLVAGGESSGGCEPIGGCSLRSAELYQ